jgi:hypothetical protein
MDSSPSGLLGDGTMPPLRALVPGEFSRDASVERELERDVRRRKWELGIREYGEEEERKRMKSRRARQRTSLFFSI